MQPFELTILGCSSATPTSERYPTAQVLQAAGRFFLIDCGEGTQIQVRKYRIRFQRISRIFISHLHGDHYLGLMGFLSSLHLLGRNNEMHIYSQAELRDIIEIQLKHSNTRLNYPIVWHPLSYDKSELLYEDEKISVESIVLNHRIPCCGFLFREKPHLRRLRKDKVDKYSIPIGWLHRIKSGEDYIADDGLVIANAEITDEPPKSLSYAFCSDTRYNEGIVEQIRGVDLLYHEATFTHDRLPRAIETFHSTAKEAATIAKMAEVKQLIIGHYSARYKDLSPLLNEARSVFENTVLAVEGNIYRAGE